MATEFELVQSEELARLRAAAERCADMERDLGVAWDEREVWRRRAERAMDAEGAPATPRGRWTGDREWESEPSACTKCNDSSDPVLTMHLGTQRPHDSLVWAIYHASAWAESGPHATGSQLADILLERWRSRWPEEAR